MGVSNVYNQAKANAIAAIKSNMATKGKKPETLKPEHLRMTGSIFNAPGVKNQPTITDLNTTRSLAELNKKPQLTPTPTNSDDPNETPSNAGEGRARANALRAQAKSLSTTTRTVEGDAGVVNSFSSSSAKLNKDIVVNDKKFTRTLQRQQSELKKDNTRLAKLNQETLEVQKEVEDAQRELDGLLARNSFSMGQQGSGSNGNQSKINDLQTFIGSKVGVLQANGKQIYSLQRSQSRTLTRMNRTNTQFIKTQQKNTKAIEQQQSKTDKVIEFATKAEGISQMVQMGGQTLKMLGQLMILGATTPWTAWMRPVGVIMEKAGVIAETVGQYGVAAANITKSAAFAADGNLMGAMQSAAAAVQSGAAAVKSTKNIKTEFGKINQQGQEATAKLEARKEVKQQKTNSLNELNKTSDGKSLIDTNGIVDQDGNITDRKEFERRLKAAGVSDKQIKNTKANAFGVDANGKRITTKAARQATTSQIIDSKYTKTAGKAFGEAKKTGFKNVASTTVKKSSTNWADNMNKISQGFMSLASMYGMFSGNGTTGSYMGGYNNMGYMNNGVPTMTDKQRRAAWRQHNEKSLPKNYKSKRA